MDVILLNGEFYMFSIGQHQRVLGFLFASLCVSLNAATDYPPSADDVSSAQGITAQELVDAGSDQGRPAPESTEIPVAQDARAPQAAEPMPGWWQPAVARGAAYAGSAQEYAAAQYRALCASRAAEIAAASYSRTADALSAAAAYIPSAEDIRNSRAAELAAAGYGYAADAACAGYTYAQQSLTAVRTAAPVVAATARSCASSACAAATAGADTFRATAAAAYDATTGTVAAGYERTAEAAAAASPYVRHAATFTTGAACAGFGAARAAVGSIATSTLACAKDIASGKAHDRHIGARFPGIPAEREMIVTLAPLQVTLITTQSDEAIAAYDAYNNPLPIDARIPFKTALFNIAHNRIQLRQFGTAFVRYIIEDITRYGDYPFDQVYIFAERLAEAMGYAATLATTARQALARGLGHGSPDSPEETQLKALIIPAMSDNQEFKRVAHHFYTTLLKRYYGTYEGYEPMRADEVGKEVKYALIAFELAKNSRFFMSPKAAMFQNWIFYSKPGLLGY